jgi:hypothetical protein
MNDETQTTRLRDVPEYGLINYDIFRPALAAIYFNLESLLAANRIAFFELVELARDETHVLWGTTGAVLTECSLLTDGTMHDAVRAVVLASTTGDEMDLRLCEPIA